MKTSKENTFCGVCKKEIRRNHACIACTCCHQWIHLTCNNLTKKDVGKLKIQTFNCLVCMEVKKKSLSKKRKKMDSTDDEMLTDTDTKVEAGSDGEFEEFEGYEDFSGKISELELSRLENIRKHQEMFEEFNIKGAKEDLASNKQRNTIKVAGLNIKRELKPREILPPRKSLRIQKIKAEMLDITKLGPLMYHPVTEDLYYVRKPEEMDMKCVNIIEEGKFESTVKTWLEDDLKFNPSIIGDKDYGEDVVRYKEKISTLAITDIAKVSKSRTYSLAWHPSKTKKIICAGDKKGGIGVWDVNCGIGKDAVFLFDVHAAQPVSCVSFSPFDPTKIYSCCYDGTFTCGDFNQMTFSQKYAAQLDGPKFNHFAWPRYKRNTVLFATSEGKVIILDLLSGKAEQTFKLNNPPQKRSMRCVDCHPVNEHLIATSLSDGTLSTWDMRMITRNANKCLSSFKAANTIVKAFFSPITGNKLLMTSQDNYLRVFDVNESGIMNTPPRHPIKHANYYGRWLTTFRAIWDPKTDHSFVCGSMAEPRRLDMFGCDDKSRKLLSYTLRSENLNYISSVNVFHPQLDLLASCNSSGKVFIWSLPPPL